jgi:hypothetical protein
MGYSDYRRLFGTMPYSAPAPAPGGIAPGPVDKSGEIGGAVGAVSQVSDLFKSGAKPIGDESYAYKPITDQPNQGQVDWLKPANISGQPELQGQDYGAINSQPVKDYNAYRGDSYWASQYPKAEELGGAAAPEPKDDTASTLSAISLISSLAGG